MNPITITVTLESEKAWALAQFLKRVTYDDVRQRAVDGDDAYTMLAAFEQVQHALRQKGVAPR